MSARNITCTNADQFTTMKKSELLEVAERNLVYLLFTSKTEEPKQVNRTRLRNSWFFFASTES